MGFIPRLESLRGIAALTVVAAHVWGQFSDAPSTGWDAAVFGGIKGLSNGTGAVVRFFVISASSWLDPSKPMPIHPATSAIAFFGFSRPPLLSLPCSRHCISGSESMSPTKVTSGPAT